MDEKRIAAIQAHMDGQQVVVRNIGKKVEVSEMELIILCTFMKLGVLEVYSHLEGDSGRLALDEIRLLKKAIQRKFTKGDFDGLYRLAQSAVAMLDGERLGQYVVEV